MRNFRQKVMTILVIASLVVAHIGINLGFGIKSVLANHSTSNKIIWDSNQNNITVNTMIDGKEYEGNNLVECLQKSNENPSMIHILKGKISLTDLEYINQTLVDSLERFASTPWVTFENQELPDSMFSNFSKLKDITIPTVEVLKNNCFKDCYNLESVSMTNLQSVYDGVWNNCYSLNTLSFGSNPPSFENENTLEPVALSSEIIFPYQAKDIYLNSAHANKEQNTWYDMELVETNQFDDSKEKMSQLSSTYSLDETYVSMILDASQAYETLNNADKAKLQQSKKNMLESEISRLVIAMQAEIAELPKSDNISLKTENIELLYNKSIKLYCFALRLPFEKQQVFDMTTLEQLCEKLSRLAQADQSTLSLQNKFDSLSNTSSREDVLSALSDYHVIAQNADLFCKEDVLNLSKLVGQFIESNSSIENPYLNLLFSAQDFDGNRRQC